MTCPSWLTSRPIAHRGLHGGVTGIVENSLSSVRAAVDAGYAVEIDVRAARDSEPIVYHDATLHRLTGQSGAVGDFAADAFANLMLSGTGEPIPRLAEILQVVAGRAPLFIEVKTGTADRAELCRRILALLRSYEGDVAVMSFDPEALVAFRTEWPALPRGIVAQSSRHEEESGLAARFSRSWMLHLGRSRPHFIAYRCDDLPALAPLGYRSALGMPLLTWTVRSEDQWRRAARWADQIIFEGFRPKQDRPQRNMT